jgi:hypothetical protein
MQYVDFQRSFVRSLSKFNGASLTDAQNYFTDRQINQLRPVQEAVAREPDIPLFDFGRVFERH